MFVLHGFLVYTVFFISVWRYAAFIYALTTSVSQVMLRDLQLGLPVCLSLLGRSGGLVAGLHLAEATAR